jgi:hypothetical protein
LEFGDRFPVEKVAVRDLFDLVYLDLCFDLPDKKLWGLKGL